VRREPKPRPIAPTVDDADRAAIVEDYQAGPARDWHISDGNRFGRCAFWDT
jgi:hypothetical protein